MLVTPPKLLNSSLSASFCVNGTYNVRNLGVIFDQTAHFKQLISNSCKVVLRKMSTIRHYISTDATKMLVCSFVLSRFDYCNGLLAAAPKYLHQKPQNIAARLIYRLSSMSYQSGNPGIGFRPVNSQIEHKLSSVCFSSVTGTGPEYLSYIPHIYFPSTVLLLTSASFASIITYFCI